MVHMLPPFVSGWLDEKNDAAAVPALDMLMAHNTQLRWAIRNRLWVMGLNSIADWRAPRRYTLAGVADQFFMVSRNWPPEP